MSETSGSQVILPVTPPEADVHAKASTGNACTWPFHQKRWGASLWMLLIGWFPLPLPMMLNLGWMFEAAAREAHHNPDRLPRFYDIPKMWLYGLVYLLLIGLYFFIPFFIFSVIYSVQTTRINDEVVDWIAIFIGNLMAQYANSFLSIFAVPQVPLTPQESFTDLFIREAAAYSTVLIVPILYSIGATALFVASMVRFAATRKLTSFFRPFKCLWLLTTHLPSFLWLLILMLVMNFAVLWLHLIGLLLWATVGMWVYAHLLGRLAARLNDAHAIT